LTSHVWLLRWACSVAAPDYDVLIVGAGPTGLAAAVYTAREDLTTLVIDKGVVGGLIATTEWVDNYPGFADGIGGLELAGHMKKQAQRFGAVIKTGIEARSLSVEDGVVTLATQTGPITARSLLVAVGSNYRKLEVPGERELEGRGVHYCATCDGPLYRGKRVIAVGGGNSALQEGLFLTKFVDKLTVLVRGEAFRGSEVLVEALRAKPNVEVRFGTSVSEVLAENGKLSGVRYKDAHGVGTIEADGLFPFIGLLPNSAWLRDSLSLDDRGFIKINKEFATNQPGVFAAGDIVEGSVGQIAAAVGEGVSAALSIRAYLDPHHQAPTYAAAQA
jgi:thioredoxin reductase (NADPH)